MTEEILEYHPNGNAKYIKRIWNEGDKYAIGYFLLNKNGILHNIDNPAAIRYDSETNKVMSKSFYNSGSLFFFKLDWENNIKLI